MGMEEDTKKLGMNFAALYELNSDIVNFRIKTPKSDKIKQALQKLSILQLAEEKRQNILMQFTMETAST